MKTDLQKNLGRTEVFKEEMRNLDRRNYLVHKLDPKFEDLQFMRSHVYEDRMELHKFTSDSFQIIKIEYDNIVKLDIDRINIYIELKNGTSYYLTEMRNNLREIFTDFGGKELCVSIDNFYVIKDYSIIGEDYGIYILKGTMIYDGENDLEEREYRDFEYKINFDDIEEIDEDYEEGYHHLQLKLANGQYIEFESEWEGDNELQKSAN
jgi:DNA-binding cell septation regulator SpoVG